ncbi:c-type cytochrome [Thalassolituus sp. LLYu03]|uniref:c-type cytochrome n=1 Tax=Thalassolituus sp. LLYu03 TaxID=3421656 RepID=UPI003D27306A
MAVFTRYLKSLLIIAMVGLTGLSAFIYSGLYPIGADVPHTSLGYWLLETVRERSINRAAADITIPADLNTATRLLSGAADYNAMCAGCHLKPGKAASDFSIGLYPSPANLTLAATADTPLATETALRRQFWIIKHGIKASGMPAWGVTHDDERIWNMVAFLQRLPGLSASQYQILTARAAD